MKPEIPAKGAHEVDAFTPWRKVLCYMQRPGVIKRIKRAYNKRVRQHTKVEIASEENDMPEFYDLGDMMNVIQKIRDAEALKEDTNGKG